MKKSHLLVVILSAFGPACLHAVPPAPPQGLHFGPAIAQPTPCNALSATGIWEEITPPGVEASLLEYGMNGAALDPTNPSRLFVGSSNSGMFRSDDCGASWVKVSTGTFGGELGVGVMSPLIDPVNPNVIYTYSLYGRYGFYKSVNGGVDWAQVLSPAVLSASPRGGFVGGYSMDPGDHQHLIVTWHDVCTAPYMPVCYAETFDAGATWTMRNGDASWAGEEGTFLQFLDSDRWIFSSSINGLWRSNDHGATWTEVPGLRVSHGMGQLYRAPNGSFFMGAKDGVLYSPDGTSWSNLPGSGSDMMGVIGDGVNVWASSAFPFGPAWRPDPHQPHRTAALASPTQWSSFPTPPLTCGADSFAYDPTRRILYSTNFWEGVWRLVLP